MGYNKFIEDSHVLRVIIPTSAVFTIVITALGLAANILLIVSILRQVTLRASPTYLMLLSMAASDALVLGCKPLFVYFLYTGGIYKSLCQIFLYSDLASVTLSTYHLVAFAVLRYLLLTKPLSATNHITAKLTVVTCLIIWAFSLGIPTLSVFFTGVTTFNVSENHTVDVCLVNFDAKPFSVSLLLVITIVPVMFLVAFHVVKYFQVKKITVPSVVGTLRRQVSAKVIIGIIVAFAVSSLPSGILWAFVLLNPELATVNLVMFAYILTLLNYLNSAINPLMYFFLSQKVNRNICLCCYLKPRTTAELSKLAEYQGGRAGALT